MARHVITHIQEDPGQFPAPSLPAQDKQDKFSRLWARTPAWLTPTCGGLLSEALLDRAESSGPGFLKLKFSGDFATARAAGCVAVAAAAPLETRSVSSSGTRLSPLRPLPSVPTENEASDVRPLVSSVTEASPSRVAPSTSCQQLATRTVRVPPPPPPSTPPATSVV